MNAANEKHRPRPSLSAASFSHQPHAAGFEGAQGLMNQEVKHVLSELLADRKKANINFQPSKVWLDALDYVGHLPSASNGVVINSMRE